MEITYIADDHDLIISTTLVYARVHFLVSLVLSVDVATTMLFRFCNINLISDF